MNKQKFEIYVFVDSIGGKIIRGILVLVCLALIYLTFTAGLNVKLSLSITALVLINELFLEQISRTKPSKQIGKEDQDMEDSLIFPAKAKYVLGNNGFEIAKKTSSSPDVRFFKEKLGLAKITQAEVKRDEILKQAYQAARFTEGKYVTEADLFASYVVLSEDVTHFLQTNNLNNDDVINLLYWTKRRFKFDQFDHHGVRFLGTGAFDTFVYGWNYELKKYSRDITTQVLSEKYAPSTIGREKEYEELVVALSKKKSSNAIIVGDEGTGKTSIVKHLAYHAFIGEIPDEIANRKVFELLVDKLLSGVQNPGDLETRLVDLLSEIAHSGDAIVYIQNIESIFGGGGFNFDLTGIVDEYLNSDKIKVIGTTTPAGYANYIQTKPSVLDLFETIQFPELSQEKTLLLLTETARVIEIKYGISIHYSALKQAVNLSSVYFPERFSPGRDMDLLEDAATRVKLDKKNSINGEDIIKLVQSKTNVVLAEPDDTEKEKLIHLEEKMHARVIGQDEAVNAIANAMRRIRSGFKNGSRPIASFLFLGPTGVGKTETAKALATEYFGNADSMIRLDMSEYQTQGQMDRILGSKNGYQENTLTEQVEKNPFSLILLDEFEKADPQLLNLFLQVLDEGRLTDNRGKTVSFANTIIIATSNAGAEMLREKRNQQQSVEKQELVDYMLKNNLFKPELLNRFDELVVFNFLNQDEVKKIAGILLTESLKSLEDNQMKVSFDESVLSKIAASAYNDDFGARDVRRYIQDNVEGFLSKEILEGIVQKGTSITLAVDQSGNFVVR